MYPPRSYILPAIAPYNFSVTMPILFLLLLVVAGCSSLPAQQSRPRLVIVISYDQFRGNYPDRWNTLWGERGFNRVAREGIAFPHCYFEHADNKTGPGHAVHLTGVYPAKSGIVSNDFFDRDAGRSFNCVEDSTALILHVPKAKYGVSPRLLRVPTLGDHMREQFPGAKVIGISLKDRGAVLMAGHRANLALWMEPDAGGFTTSTYYTVSLPQWLVAWNQRGMIASAGGKHWEQALPDKEYAVSDKLLWEGKYPGGNRSFPHAIPSFDSTDTFWYPFILSPYSIEAEFDLAMEAIRSEKLGADATPDLLCISVSATDYIGHLFGPDSRETQDIYYHADRVLGEFIDAVDKTVGRENYVLVITSDHGVAPVPEMLLADSVRTRVDAGRIRSIDLLGDIDEYLQSAFPAGDSVQWIRAFNPPSLFLHDAAFAAAGVERPTVVDSLRAFLLRCPGIGIVVANREMQQGRATETPEDMYRLIRNDWYPPRSGDLLIYTRPYWVFGPAPANHGTPYDYDRHVPLMMLGVVPETPALRERRVSPADIAPTLARLLGVDMPGTDGVALPLHR